MDPVEDAVYQLTGFRGVGLRIACGQPNEDGSKCGLDYGHMGGCSMVVTLPEPDDA
jgi:hypothetical protein